ncbi:hypothetical protein HDU76_005059 [Blyttiomyces sp. JEL0837]|nr:hypothetical protein HDU76_005059 [Blyttiomyces sp. JEL0837]
MVVESIGHSHEQQGERALEEELDEDKQGTDSTDETVNDGELMIVDMDMEILPEQDELLCPPSPSEVISLHSSDSPSIPASPLTIPPAARRDSAVMISDDQESKSGLKRGRDEDDSFSGEVEEDINIFQIQFNGTFISRKRHQVYNNNNETGAGSLADIMEMEQKLDTNQRTRYLPPLSNTITTMEDVNNASCLCYRDGDEFVEEVHHRRQRWLPIRKLCDGTCKDWLYETFLK